MGQTERCTYCMLGSISGGRCTHCGRTGLETSIRSEQALPPRHMLCQKQYYLGRVLGNGGFGITYLAWDCKNKRRVAVKELFPKQTVSRMGGFRILAAPDKQQYFQHVKKRFCEEAQVLYELRNVPEVMDVYHLFEENGTAYYVMEYLEGEDLKRNLSKNGKMKWVQIKDSLCMILRALHVLHSKNLIHRDITPDNIFLMKNGGAKLLDFGSARSYMGSDNLTVILKKQFAPYEQFAENGKQGPWTDIYSLSVTLYYALSGVLPPMATARIFAIKSHPAHQDPVKPIEELCPDLPGNVSYALHKGMEVMAEQRYQTIQQFTEQLFPGMDILAAYPKERARKQPSGMRLGQTIRVKCEKGILPGENQELRPGIITTIGRGVDCQIQYPSDSRGISRRQCSFTLDNKKIAYIRDENSSFGTYVDGNRLNPMVWYPIKSGNKISFAQEEYRLVKEIK